MRLSALHVLPLAFALVISSLTTASFFKQSFGLATPNSVCNSETRLSKSSAPNSFLREQTLRPCGRPKSVPCSVERDRLCGPDNQQALSLGILYKDTVGKKRWVLKFDDEKALDQIDAVFVTLEPNGQSHKPSGKSLLFAYLKVNPNHP